MLTGFPAHTIWFLTPKRKPLPLGEVYPYAIDAPRVRTLSWTLFEKP